MDPTVPVLVIAGFFGVFIGSFLNVCVLRLPRNESVAYPPSRCWSCGTRLTWYDNLPVVGWLLLRGRCRACGTGFSVGYLFAELAVGALTAGCAWFALNNPSLWAQGRLIPGAVAFGLLLAPLLILAWTLYVATRIDIDHLIIPDELTKLLQLFAPFLAAAAGTALRIEDPLPARWILAISDSGAMTGTTPGRCALVMGGIALGSAVLLVASLPLARFIYDRYHGGFPWSDADHRGFRTDVLWFVGCIVVQVAALAGLLWWQPGSWWLPAVVAFSQSLLGSLVGWGSLYLVGLLGTAAFKRNAMGFGDVKLLAPIGAFLGPVGVVYAFFAASCVGAVIGIPQRLLRATREIPFGPYLAIGALLVLVLGPWFHQRLFANLVLP